MPRAICNQRFDRILLSESLSVHVSIGTKTPDYDKSIDVKLITILPALFNSLYELFKSNSNTLLVLDYIKVLDFPLSPRFSVYVLVKYTNAITRHTVVTPRIFKYSNL